MTTSCPSLVEGICIGDLGEERTWVFSKGMKSKTIYDYSCNLDYSRQLEIHNTVLSCRYSHSLTQVESRRLRCESWIDVCFQ